MSAPDAGVLARLSAAHLDVEPLVRLVDSALDEDLAGGEDVTSAATVPDDAVARATFVPRSSGVVAGMDVAALVMARAARAPIAATAVATDGAVVEAGEPLLVCQGLARDLLLGERTALNLMGRMSGVATLTRAWVDAVARTGAAVRDTRKTTPMLRSLEK